MMVNVTLVAILTQTTLGMQLAAYMVRLAHIYCTLCHHVVGLYITASKKQSCGYNANKCSIQATTADYSATQIASAEGRLQNTIAIVVFTQYAKSYCTATNNVN